MFPIRNYQQGGGVSPKKRVILVETPKSVERYVDLTPVDDKKYPIGDYNGVLARDGRNKLFDAILKFKQRNNITAGDYEDGDKIADLAIEKIENFATPSELFKAVKDEYNIDISKDNEILDAYKKASGYPGVDKYGFDKFKVDISNEEIIDDTFLLEAEKVRKLSEENGVPAEIIPIYGKDQFEQFKSKYNKDVLKGSDVVILGHSSTRQMLGVPNKDINNFLKDNMDSANICYGGTCYGPEVAESMSDVPNFTVNTGKPWVGIPEYKNYKGRDFSETFFGILDSPDYGRKDVVKKAIYGKDYINFRKDPIKYIKSQGLEYIDQDEPIVSNRGFNPETATDSDYQIEEHNRRIDSRQPPTLTPRRFQVTPLKQGGSTNNLTMKKTKKSYYKQDGAPNTLNISGIPNAQTGGATNPFGYYGGAGDMLTSIFGNVSGSGLFNTQAVETPEKYTKWLKTKGYHPVLDAPHKVGEYSAYLSSIDGKKQFNEMLPLGVQLAGLMDLQMKEQDEVANKKMTVQDFPASNATYAPVGFAQEGGGVGNQQEMFPALNALQELPPEMPKKARKQVGEAAMKEVQVLEQMLGYRDDSPFRNKPSININSDTITMDGVGKTLIATSDNGISKILKPNSGTHFFPGANMVTEVPVAQDGLLLDGVIITGSRINKVSNSYDASQNRIISDEWKNVGIVDLIPQNFYANYVSSIKPLNGVGLKSGDAQYNVRALMKNAASRPKTDSTYDKNFFEKESGKENSAYTTPEGNRFHGVKIIGKDRYEVDGIRYNQPNNFQDRGRYQLADKKSGKSIQLDVESIAGVKFPTIDEILKQDDWVITEVENHHVSGELRYTVKPNPSKLNNKATETKRQEVSVSSLPNKLLGSIKSNINSSIGYPTLNLSTLTEKQVPENTDNVEPTITNRFEVPKEKAEEWKYKYLPEYNGKKLGSFLHNEEVIIDEKPYTFHRGKLKFIGYDNSELGIDQVATKKIKKIGNSFQQGGKPTFKFTNENGPRGFGFNTDGSYSPADQVGNKRNLANNYGKLDFERGSYISRNDAYKIPMDYTFTQANEQENQYSSISPKSRLTYHDKLGLISFIDKSDNTVVLDPRDFNKRVQKAIKDNGTNIMDTEYGRNYLHKAGGFDIRIPGDDLTVYETNAPRIRSVYNQKDQNMGYLNDINNIGTTNIKPNKYYQYDKEGINPISAKLETKYRQDAANSDKKFEAVLNDLKYINKNYFPDISFDDIEQYLDRLDLNSIQNEDLFNRLKSFKKNRDEDRILERKMHKSLNEYYPTVGYKSHPGKSMYEDTKSSFQQGGEPQQSQYRVNDEDEMIEGIIEILTQIGDLNNRQEAALQQLDKLRNEGIEIDEEDFMVKVMGKKEDYKNGGRPKNNNNEIIKLLGMNKYANGGKVMQNYMPVGNGKTKVESYIPLAAMIPIQTEKKELIVLPTGDLVKVNASKRHSQMSDDEVTDIVPENSYILSQFGSVDIYKSEADQIQMEVENKPYNMYGSNPTPKVKTLGDIMRKKVMKPADMARLVEQKYKIMDHDDPFTIQTNAINKHRRGDYLQAIIQLSEYDKARKGIDNSIETQLSQNNQQPPQMVASNGGKVLRAGYNVPKAWLGAAIGGATSLISAGVSAYQNAQARKRADRLMNQQLGDISGYESGVRKNLGLGLGIGAATTLLQDPTINPAIESDQFISQLPSYVNASNNAVFEGNRNSLYANRPDTSAMTPQMAMLFGERYNAQTMQAQGQLAGQLAGQRANTFAQYLQARQNIFNKNSASRTAATNATRTNQNNMMTTLGGMGMGYFDNLNNLSGNVLNARAAARGQNTATHIQLGNQMAQSVNNSMALGLQAYNSYMAAQPKPVPFANNPSLQNPSFTFNPQFPTPAAPTLYPQTGYNFGNVNTWRTRG